MKNKYLAVVLLGLAMTSCTANFADINKEPYTVDDDEMLRDGYSTNSPLIGLQNLITPTREHIHQFQEVFIGGSYGGYFTEISNKFKQKFSTYNPEEPWINASFSDILTETFQNLKSLKEKSSDEVLLSVATICKVAAVSKVTDLYGPIPYTKIGENSKLQVELDSQETVYMTMFDELDTAIEILSKHAAEQFSADADAVFGGNIEKWAKYANSLKLRLAMRVSNVAPELAQLKAEEAISHKIGVMESVSESALLETTKNPYEITVLKWGDSGVSADIMTYMNSYNDPRREKYFTVSTFDPKTAPIKENGFVGMRNGISEITIGTEYWGSYSSMVVQTSTPVPLMYASEVAFLRAEGALKGWNMNGTAKDFYNRGIELSFEQWGAKGAAEYINNSTDLPKLYKDPFDKYSYSGKVSLAPIKWSDDKPDLNLEQIITQKWIANYPLGIESWSEYRRTGYPHLMETIDNKSAGVVNSSRHARRIPFPQNEYKENGVNITQAIGEYLDGPDNMATDLWWAKRK